MRYLKTSMIILITMMLAIALASCSGSSKSQSPLEPGNQISDLPSSFGTEDTSGRSILAVYDAVIDPVARTFTVTPAERTAYYHYPLTQLYPNVLRIVGYGFTTYFWADIRLVHPFPGSGIDAFDPRVIAIVPANPSVSFNYPVMGVTGNDMVVMEPDGYTPLFDNLAPTITGNVNPFKAYFKSQPYRRWSSTGMTSETQRWNLKLSGFGGPMVYKLVVDVSTNYPNPPTPVTDNAKDPAAITAVIGSGLYSSGGSAQIDVTILDWQGPTGSTVTMESPYIFTGTVELSYFGPGPNPNEYVFRGTINNSLGVSEGNYGLLVGVKDASANVSIYNEFRAIVGPSLFNISDVTPPVLNMRPMASFAEAKYFYFTSFGDGLYIFDITNPLDPVMVSRVPVWGAQESVYVSNGYAYVASDDLYIIDVDPPESAHVVQVVDCDYVFGVYASGSYAYATDHYLGLKIINIDPPESAYIVNTVITAPGAIALWGVCEIGGYAYVEDEFAGLRIIDVDPPESAYIVKTVPTALNAWHVAVSGGYAYVSSYDVGLQIIDVDPIESASIVRTVGLAPSYGLCVYNGYAYVASGADLNIINIASPESAYVVNSLNMPGGARSSCVSGGYAYSISIGAGFHVVDIDPPESAFIVKSIPSAWAIVDVFVDGGYAYVTNSIYGLQILKVAYPESASINKNVPFSGSGNVKDVYESGGYAYVTEGYYGLHIVDVDPPKNAYIVNSVPTTGNPDGVFSAGGYTYVADGSSGLQIIDTDPPESAHIVNTVSTPDVATGVFVGDGYAYVTDKEKGLSIIDINPPGSAYIVKDVSIASSSWNVYVTGGYAYVASDVGGLRIIDVDPPESAYIVNTVATPDAAMDVYVSGSYAFVADSFSGMQIISISPPESASIVGTAPTICTAQNIFISGDYAFVANIYDGYHLRAGLNIIKLH